MRPVRRAIQDHPSVLSTQRVHISTLLNHRKRLKLYTTVIPQTYLYRAKTVTTQIQKSSNVPKTSMPDDTEGSIGGESTASPTATAGCVEGRKQVFKDLCSSSVDLLLEAR
jgi:hypothetical protein